ncbi:phosphopentomutase [Rhizobacter sp. Root404]|uniref:phosphopentomutase n=1 Tax=Rhizobacter sp. Root404 TaxID=1736528 RepID=UPI0006FEA5B5|nr:phosphopentomutase [Rhizobacter sp. Root404]KQW34709.1 phosphopentomutase [Rhizobacter sp. Root404]
MTRALVIVLDSFGLGAAPDAPRFGDVGADTFGHIAQWCVANGRPLRLPNLARLGLPQAARAASGQWPAGVERRAKPDGAFGAAAEVSLGKDTPSGHWELMGCPVAFDWGYFPKTDDPAASVFPPALMQRWLTACGLGGALGNCHASGTEIIERLGDEHLRTGWPVCYTSSDSVFQVAAHETHFGLDRLYAICTQAKTIFDEANIARVIARPFVGENGRYRRTAHRHDYTTPPPAPTLLDVLKHAGREVHGIGKISDIFAARGITHSRTGDGNAELCAQTLEAWRGCADGGLVFANLVDFDMLFGHRRDVAGYADALEAFDAFLPRLLAELGPGDLLALSADHGCDPTWPGSDHTREHVPLLFAGPAAPRGRDLGVRSTFADLGQTLAAHLHVEPLAHGKTCFVR